MGSWRSDDLDWDVALTPDVPLQLVFETGASDITLAPARGAHPGRTVGMVGT